MNSIGIIGLGKMGGAIAGRLTQAGLKVFGYDPNSENCALAQRDGVIIEQSIQSLAQKNAIIWLMVPAGKIVDHVLDELDPFLNNHIIVDGGNSLFIDSIARANKLAKKNNAFIDCGTSGGVHGRENGFCLMIGGSQAAFDQLIPFLEILAAPNGYAYIGSSGAGHYVKMVHNGIEYALMQAYAQGLHLIHEGFFKHEQLDLEKITNLWNSGSVIRSWLLELTNNIFKKQGIDLMDISGKVAESGMGLWTIKEAHNHTISVSLIEESLRIRHESQKNGGDYSTKLVALMRNQFGGHTFEKITPQEKNSEDN
jgi:6-phosphogluconate dehydrogenase